MQINKPIPTLHLHQELGLDPASRLTLVLAPGAAQRVDLVDEDDGRTVFPGQLEQVLHQPGGKAERNQRSQGGVSHKHHYPRLALWIKTPAVGIFIHSTLLACSLKGSGCRVLGDWC